MYENLYVYNNSGVEFPSKVVLSGISYCDASYFINRPNSRFSTVEYIISGSGTIVLDGKEYTASAGDAYYLPNNKDQYYYSSADDPWIKIFFNLTGNIGNMLAEEYMLTNKIVFKNCNIEDLMRELFSFRENGLSPLEMQQKSLLQVHRVFMQIHSNLQVSEILPPELKQLKDFIDINITGNITLEQMAANIYRSKNYVINLFKENLEQTPYEYFLEKKMMLAKRLLSDTSIPIKQISDYLSFENPHYFSSSFRRRFGTSPLTYRRRKLDSNE